MPPIHVRVFRNAKGEAPLAGWLAELETRDKKAFAKCLERIMRLGEMGHEINRHREWSAYLRDGIYELRIHRGRVNYRILYFFVPKHGFACLSHGLTKEAEVPPVDIERAIEFKKLVESDPNKYSADFEL